MRRSMHSSMELLGSWRKMLAHNRYLSRERNTEGIALVHFVRSAVLLLTFAAFALVLFGRDLKVIGLTVGIGWLLIILTEVWRLPEDH